jgi:DNA-binding transcriptional MocR family regulator
MVFTVPAYQNPTGTVLAATRRTALLALCERYRVPLVEDDVYGELGFDESQNQATCISKWGSLETCLRLEAILRQIAGQAENS